MITQEHEYFIRFILLLLQAGTDLLREILKKALQKKGETLDQFLIIVKPVVQKDRKLNQVQKDTLYPLSPQAASTKDFDITLLSHLLSKHKYLGRLIDSNETNAVNDIRQLRNTYHAHAHEAKMDIVTFTREWNQLATVIRYTGNGLPPDVQQRHRDMVVSIENEQLDITSVVEQIKKLDLSSDFYHNIQTCLHDMSRVQKKLIATVENVKKMAKNTDNAIENVKISVQKSEVEIVDTHKDVLDTKEEVIQMKALLVQIKEQRENQGRPTKVVNTIYGKLSISAEDQDTVDKAEAILLEASNNSIAKKEPTDTSHKILQEKVSLAIEDIENKDVKVESVIKGSIILELKCLSLTAILELIDYFYSPSFQRRVDEVAQALGDIIGKNICVTAVEIDKHSVQDVILKMDKKEYEKVVQLELSCRGVDGLVHALEVFEEGKAVNSINELSNALSDAVGKPVTLHTSIDMNQMSNAIKLIPDKQGYDSQDSCTKGNDPLINPITTFQNMELTQSGSKQDISEFESEDERIKHSRPSTYRQTSCRNISFEADEETKTSRTYKRLRSSEHGAPKSEYETPSYTQAYISRDLRTKVNDPTIIPITFRNIVAGLTQSSARQNISDIESGDELLKHPTSSLYLQPKNQKLLFEADKVAEPSRPFKCLQCIKQDAPKAKYRIPNYTQCRSKEVYEHSSKNLALQPSMLSLQNQNQYDLVYLKEINVGLQTEPHTRILHRCAVLSPNKLLKAYYFDKYLEIVDTNTGSVLQQKILNGFPCGISALPYSQAAVTFPNTDEILILSADNLSTIRSIPVESCPSGITYHQDELLYVICTQDKLQIVRVLNLQGGSLRKFELDSADFFDIFMTVAVSKDQHSLYITDYNTKSLIRYSLIGLTTAKRVFNELLWVRWNTGQALLDDGSVLFLCGKPGSIYHVSADLKQGYELERIATEANCISYDSENNLVYVGCKNAIHVYILREHGQKQAENKFRYPETEEYLACLNTEETSN